MLMFAMTRLLVKTIPATKLLPACHSARIGVDPFVSPTIWTPAGTKVPDEFSQYEPL